jgi:hypothetical protein
VIFGFGMTIAGGCTVGSTWRAGEGHVKLMLSLLGIVLGLPLTAEYVRPAFFASLPGWTRQQLFLPDVSGYGGALCIILLVLLLWYRFVIWNGRTGRLSAL